VIRRLLALLALAWALGFALFVVALPPPAGEERTDGIVVLTGGPGRIARGLALLRRDRAHRMLISGVGRSVRKVDIARVQRIPAALLDRIDLGHGAVDTRSNADETADWIAHHGYRTIRLVTADTHMRRARLEFARATPGIALIADAVPTAEPSLSALLREYHKYLLRRAGQLTGN
jgi:uncharacterized SAM-binding protein YcdF (DUF218 family)